MNVLVMLGLTLPELDPALLAAIQKAAGSDATVDIAANAEDALQLIADADVVLGRLDLELLNAAPNLRWVHATASGVDAFMFPEFQNGEIQLTSEKGLVGPHLADHAMALLLALTRQLGPAIKLGAKGWAERVGMRRVALELEGLTMGVVGFGGTGRALATRAIAFGVEVRAVDREPVPPTPEVPLVLGLSSLPSLLAASDIVAICAPLTEETRDLIDERAFAQMKPGAILVNVTRGEIVNTDALVEALRSGRLGGAALDVVGGEPLPPEHPFWAFENVISTPHTAGASPARARRNVERFCENLRRLRNGSPLVGLIDKQAGF